jgi:protein-arginine deiminase
MHGFPSNQQIKNLKIENFMFESNLDSNLNPGNFDQNFSLDEYFPSTVDANSNSMMPMSTASGTSQNDLIEITNSYNQDNSDRHIPLGTDGVNCGVVDSEDELFATNPGVTLLADTNRDGQVNDLDQEGKQTWDNQHGAIFLPNLDDDSGKFQDVKVPEGIEGDRQLAKLNDANDSIVNGSEDEKDLAELKIQPWENAPDDTTVRLHTDSKSQPYVRMFLKKDGQYTAIENDSTLQLSDLRNGASLAIEGKDIVRDQAKWDGFVDLTLEAKTGEQTYSDQVKLRVSPVLFQNNLMPVQELYATKYPDQATLDAESQSIDKLVQDARNQELTPEQQELIRLGKSLQLNEADQQKSEQYKRDGHSDFISDINTSLQSNTSSPDFRLLDASGDQWTQDIFEPGYASMPAADGGQQIMHIFYRSANTSRSIEGFLDKEKTESLREGGNSVFTELAGKDIGGVQQFSESWQKNPNNSLQDTYNSTGNFEAIPSYQFNGENYPVGRMIFGSAEGNQPDPSFVKMLESQGYQDPITVDSSWLAVGHVDEFINFVPAPNERGWTMAVSSPDAALGILRDAQLKGNGNTELFNGLETTQTGENGSKLVPATKTIDNLLADDSLIKANEFAQQKVNEAVEKIKAQTGISDQEIVKLPVLYKNEDLGGNTSQTEKSSNGDPNYKLLAFVPGVTNGVVVNDQYLAPKQHGPVVNGVDLFEQDVEDKLSPLGSNVKWIEDWHYAHEGGGEVHCTTNALREPSQSDPWWQEYS